MATIKVYTRNLWQVHRVVCEKLGLKIAWSSSEARTIVLSTDVMIATVLKVLTDKGIITDAELLAVFTSVRNAEFPRLPAEIPAPGEGEEIPDPDLGN